MAEHVERGQVEAALAIPEAAIRYLRKGELVVMYDNKLPYEVYGEIMQLRAPGRHGQQLHGHQEVVRRQPEQAAGLPGPVGGGHQGWRDNQAEIIKTYPQHFAVEEDEDIKAMQGYLADHDWFVDTVYLDDDVDRERDDALRPDEGDEVHGGGRADAGVRGDRSRPAAV